MKKLMILGASKSQLPLIAAAKKMGVHTIAVSTPGDWPGLSAADEASLTDITDPEAVCRAAAAHKIDGITTCCLDSGVRAIGYTSERLHLCGPSAQAARISSDKYLMKEAFRAAGVSCAEHRLVRSDAEFAQALESLSFPVVTKAVDLMGSRGIFRCSTPEEAWGNYRRTMEATGQDYCIVEEFLEGTVFGAEAMVSDGELVFCMLDNTEVFEAYVPTPVGHSVPFEASPEICEQAREQVEKAIRAVGLDNCPINADLILKDGRVYVIEVTGRAGATCLPEIVGDQYGLDYYEMIVRQALGMQVKAFFQNPPAPHACLSQTLLSSRAGIVKKVNNQNEASEELLELSLYMKPGDSVRRYTNGRDMLGQVIVRGDTLSACRASLKQVLGKIDIEIED